jgi:hypothetical protein
LKHASDYIREFDIVDRITDAGERWIRRGAFAVVLGAVAFALLGCGRKDGRVEVSDIRTICISGVRYFNDGGHSATSPVIDRDTLQPQRCE